MPESLKKIIPQLGDGGEGGTQKYDGGNKNFLGHPSVRVCCVNNGRKDAEHNYREYGNENVIDEFIVEDHKRLLLAV